MHQSYSLNKYDNKQSLPVTLHNSTQVSFQQPMRKYSMAEPNHKIDIDQVMVDIKLTPLKSNQFVEKVKIIYTCLEYLKKISPSLLQEVRTAELIIQSIQSKWKKHQTQTKRGQNYNQSHTKTFIQGSQTFKSSAKKSQIQLLSKRKPNHNILNSNICSQVSPIKQLDQATSRIVYTNFSIKEIQNSCKKQFSHKKQSAQRQSMDNRISQKKLQLNQSQSTKQIRAQSGSKSRPMHKKQNSIFTVSVFDAEDEEMQRLTKNIQALDRVLEQKGLGFRNEFTKDKNGKMALKQVTLNTAKQSLIFKSQKKPLIFNSKHKNSSNKQNL